MKKMLFTRLSHEHTVKDLERNRGGFGDGRLHYAFHCLVGVKRALEEPDCRGELCSRLSSLE
jgi:hypothetical protein